MLPNIQILIDSTPITEAAAALNRRTGVLGEGLSLVDQTEHVVDVGH